MDDNNQIIIYQSKDGETRIDVKFPGETVWLSQQQMADLYQSSRSNVVEHIKHIYEDGELDEESTCRNFRQVRQKGSRQVTREIPFYNLDMIISLGYRIRSVIATHFRRWATERLKEYFPQQKRLCSTVPVRSAISRQWTKLARNTANFR